MKKNSLSFLVAGLLMANVAGADPVAVKDGAIFIVSNGVLSVQSADDSELPATCGVAPALPMAIENATDVVIDDGKAFVTSVDEAGAVSVTSVDVSECLSSSCDAEPVVDLNSGVLFIPCLEVNDQRYDITMEQRGNSMNWEVTGFPESTHHRGHDDDDDDD